MTDSGTLGYAATGGNSGNAKARSPRLWPGVVLALLQWLAIELPVRFAPQSAAHFMGMTFGPVVGTAAVLIWWMTLSRFPWRVRWFGLAAFVALPVAAFFLMHRSMRMPLYTLGLASATSAFVLAAVVGSYLGRGGLRIALIAGPLMVWTLACLLRMNGANGNIRMDFSWRWTQTDEDRYLAALKNDPSLGGINTNVAREKFLLNAPVALTLSPGDWAGFRGNNRDGRVTGVSIKTDWAEHPPKQAWKHLIGPGWSSFCVVGDRVFTQAQLGDQEVVYCYDLQSGVQVWAHEDDTRFAEDLAGPGPRATPTFADGKLYSFGATGRLNCLDPRTGKTIWTRDVAADAGATVPYWGFASSPLVAQGLVTVITGAKGKSVMAYDANTGQVKWSTGDGFSYASMQLSRLAGVDQLLFVNAAGLTALDPLHGQVLWSHSFPLPGNANRVVQPAILDDNDVILGVAFGIGTRRIHVTHEGNNWTTREVWTSPKFKPYYNDMVVHGGNIYGFDGEFFACVNPETGASRWRARGYGNGQVLLIEDQNLLLILSEQGEVALVDAKPDEYHEIARFQAIEGKTWNHPVIAHGKLLVRNGHEIACYDVK